MDKQEMEDDLCRGILFDCAPDDKKSLLELLWDSDAVDEALLNLLASTQSRMPNLDPQTRVLLRACERVLGEFAELKIELNEDIK